MSCRPAVAARLASLVLLIGIGLPAISQAQLGAAELRCQKKAAGKAKGLVRGSLKQLARCHDAIARGSLPVGTDCRSEADTSSRIQRSEDRLRSAIQKGCPDAVVAAVPFGGPCFGAASSAELESCSVSEHAAEVDRLITAAYATDAVLAKQDAACQKKASSQLRRYAGARLAKLQACRNKLSKGVLPASTDCTSEALTASRIAKVRDRAAVKIGAACSDALVASVGFGFPCAGAATSADLAECLLSQVELSSDDWVLAEYGTTPTGSTASLRLITDPADCVGGPLSRCRVGDYLFENDQIRVVVQSVQRNINAVGLYGGQIIDADLNRGGAPEIDSFEEWATSINLENTAHYTSLELVNDGSDGQPALLRAVGVDDLLDTLNPSSTVASFGFASPASTDDVDLPVEITTDYSLAPGDNFVRVRTWLQNLDPASAYDIFFGDVLNGSGQVDLFQPGYGFGEPLVTSRCPVDAPNPCNVVVYRGVDGAAQVSYGYVHEVPGSTSFTTSGVTLPQLGQELTLALVGASPPNFTLERQGQPGDFLDFTRWFVVGDGSVSSILAARDEIQNRATGRIEGQVTVAGGGPAVGAEVAVLGDPAEGPVGLAGITRNVVNHTVTDAAGQYSLAVAPGDYEVVVNLEGHPYQGGGASPASNPVSVPAFGTASLDLSVPDAGTLQVSVTDGELDALPAKVSVVGFDPSVDPGNSQSILGLINNDTAVFRDRRQDGLPFGVTRVLFIDPGGISDVVAVEPGDYQVVVSRGPEYSLDSQPVTISSGALSGVTAVIGPVVDTDGFVSGDFHVHSLDSPDSEVTREERVVSMLGEGLEFFTPSDHEFRGDFQSIVNAAGWGAWVQTAPGNEITTFDYGHFNSWPMTVDPAQVNGGSVDHGGAAAVAGEDFPSFGNYSLTPEEIITAAQADPGPDTVQINHIHSHFGLQGGSGLAIDTGLEPPQSAVPPAARRLDPAAEDVQRGYFSDVFDALEIWIGGGRGQIFGNFLGENAGDWFNLLNQGIVRTGIADSDTHQRFMTQSGIPRSLIASATDEPALLDPDSLSAAVNAGRVIGTNGPMVRVQVEALATGSQARLELGQPTLVSAADGRVEVQVEVQSASWVEFDRIELYVNSTTTRTTDSAESGAGPVSFNRYGIAPDLVLLKDVDFTVNPVVVDPLLPDGVRLEASATFVLDGATNPALAEDSWLVVMVKGTDGVSRPLYPVIPNDLDSGANSVLADLLDGNVGESGVLALAFTNPLFVDVNDGAGGGPDGDYDPPGVRVAP